MKNTIKKFYLFLLLSACFSIFSCNNNSEIKLAYSDTETIKEQIYLKESEISWTKELEPDRLSTGNTQSERIDTKSISLTPDVAKIIQNFDTPEYPELLDFGKLDSSSLSYSALDKVQSFCKSLSKDIYAGPDVYFNSTYKFNYIFFRDEFIKKWKINFNEDFPFTEDQAKEIRDKKQKNEQLKARISSIEEQIKNYEEFLMNKGKSDSIEESELEISENIDENKITPVEQPKEGPEDIEKLKKQFVQVEDFNLLNTWILGQPFIGEEITELPVRLYCNMGAIDITLYLNHKKQYSIYQVTIDRWSKI